MVFARSSKAAARLSKMFKEKEIVKKYLAVIEGTLKEDGEFEDYLLKMEKKSVVDSKGKFSKLKYKVLKNKDNKTLVEIDLITGRHHQIRVQFSSRGYPLVGEKRYANSEGDELALFAYYLEFTHPVTKERVYFKHIPKNKEIEGML